MGPLRLRTRLGHRPRGLQRRRPGLAVPPPRPCAVARRTAGARTGWRPSATRPRPSCSASALWNGVDPILKERMFGLSGPEGNHGEDVKDYWWYLDSTPTHSWMTWRYHYPQREFPYADLVAENARRGKLDREYELVDTGVFDDDRYWVVTVDYAKADPRDLLDAHHRREPRPGRGHDPRAADAVVPQHLVVRAARASTRSVHHRDRRSARRAAPRARDAHPRRERRARAPVLRQRDEQPAPVGRARALARFPRTASTTTSSAGCRR